ncbi:MAG TPA: hypothetical protein VI248_06895 [Kineosporiaceae bacterium]
MVLSAGNAPWGETGQGWPAARAAKQGQIPLAVVKPTLWAAQLELIDRFLGGGHDDGRFLPAGPPPGLIDQVAALTQPFAAGLLRGVGAGRR